MERDFVDLIDLQRDLKEGVEDLFPDRVWVRAEVASVSVKSNGHCYLDLSQSDSTGVVAKAKAVIWRGNYYPIREYFREATGGDIVAGIVIMARVAVNYSPLYGLTLSIDEVEPQFTLGEAELAKQRTIEALRSEGMMDLQKELAMPLLPYRLAVISARDAAGFGDFRRHLASNEYGFAFAVDLFEAAMQGETAPASMVDALDRIETSGKQYDAVLIMRGGGSVLDLACFDDYGLCLRIAGFPLPVFTAVGHDKDYHVADMVAHAFVKTPTALADLFIDALAAEDERIGSFSTRLRLAFVSKIAAMSSKVDLLAQRIRSADPRCVLSRGYTLVTDGSGVPARSCSAFREGDRIIVMFEDGSLDCTVNGKV